MAILEILHHPDPRLRKKSKEIDKVDDTITTLIDNMLTTMYAAPGIGLAAPQVNQQIRLIVIDISEDKNQPLVLINPEIIAKLGAKTAEEGCLSVPGFYEPVTRSETIEVKALDKNAKKITLQAEGLLAVCIQHEIDHLDGKLFVDYLSKMKQSRILKKIEKHERLSL